MSLSYKDLVYDFMGLSPIVRESILKKLHLIKDDEQEIRHVNLLEAIIKRAEDQNCIGEFWNLIQEKKFKEIHNQKQITVDGTKLVANDIANILNEFPMCDLAIDDGNLLILDHTGIIIKMIEIN